MQIISKEDCIDLDNNIYPLDINQDGLLGSKIQLSARKINTDFKLYHPEKETNVPSSKLPYEDNIFINNNKLSQKINHNLSMLLLDNIRKNLKQ